MRCDLGTPCDVGKNVESITPGNEGDVDTSCHGKDMLTNDPWHGDDQHEEADGSIQSPALDDETYGEASLLESMSRPSTSRSHGRSAVNRVPQLFACAAEVRPSPRTASKKERELQEHLQRERDALQRERDRHAAVEDFMLRQSHLLLGNIHAPEREHIRKEASLKEREEVLRERCAAFAVQSQHLAVRESKIVEREATASAVPATPARSSTQPAQDADLSFLLAYDAAVQTTPSLERRYDQPTRQPVVQPDAIPEAQEDRGAWGYLESAVGIAIAGLVFVAL